MLAAELLGAWITGSLALLTDAAHMVTDAVGLAIALGAAAVTASRANDRRTWGLRRIEVVAALVQALLLIGVAVFVVVEAIGRIGRSPEIPAAELLLFAVIGLVGNAAAIAVLARGRTRSLNLRAAFLEVLGDAIGSVGVIVAAVVIWTTGFTEADSIVAILIGAFIVPRAIRLLWDALGVVLEVTPKDLDLGSVRAHLEAMDDVRSVHDLHVSRISSDLPVLTAHVVVDDACFRDGRAPELLGAAAGVRREPFRRVDRALDVPARIRGAPRRGACRACLSVVPSRTGWRRGIARGSSAERARIGSHTSATRCSRSR